MLSLRQEEQHCLWRSFWTIPAAPKCPPAPLRQTCEKCGAEYGILGHKWKTRRTSSLGNGTHRIICLRCGLNGTASCTGGTTTCTTKAVSEACGGKYGKRNPNNHALVHYDAQAPTCTKPGWDALTPVPAATYTTFRAIPCAKNMQLEHHEAKAPTCTEKGLGCLTTPAPAAIIPPAREIPALNHALEQHAAKAPTCTEPGWDAYETCSRFDYTTHAELPAQHDLRHHAAKAPHLYRVAGMHDLLRCDYTTTYVELPALNHALEQHEAQAPHLYGNRLGCLRNLLPLRLYHPQRALPALNHALEQHAAKAPTCTEPGWDALRNLFPLRLYHPQRAARTA